jgi:CRP/FNR family transcriptional regulator
MQELTAQELIARVPYFASLAPAIRDDIIRACGRRAVTGDSLLFLEGEPSAGWFGIAAGSIRIYKAAPNGREQTLHLLQEGDQFNDVAALDGGPNPVSAWVLADSVLYHLPAATLGALVEQYPPLARAVVVFLAQRARLLVTKVESHALQGVDARLAQLLLEEEARQGEGDGLIPRQRWLTQEAIAAHLGTAREVVGRGLRRFATDGVIAFDRRQIEFLDRTALERIAQQ